jgi:hypothetical protein
LNTTWLLCVMSTKLPGVGLDADTDALGDEEADGSVCAGNDKVRHIVMKESDAI